jgi:RecG-like helicase
MKKKDLNTEMRGLTCIYHLLTEYKQTKNEKLLDKALTFVIKLHENIDRGVRKQKRRDSTEEINNLINEMNNKK